MTARVDLEREALEQFAARAREHGFVPLGGQGRGNRLVLMGNNYFQFGDLRVDTPTGHIVIEAESAGGVTNLIKYWYCLKSALIRRPMTLIHLFRQTSSQDYVAHLKLWDFLCDRMKSDLAGEFDAIRFQYRSLQDLLPALRHFESLLAESNRRNQP